MPRLNWREKGKKKQRTVLHRAAEPLQRFLKPLQFLTSLSVPSAKIKEIKEKERKMKEKTERGMSEHGSQGQ